MCVTGNGNLIPLSNTICLEPKEDFMGKSLPTGPATTLPFLRVLSDSSQAP